MLAANQAPEAPLALEAAEFWGALCESELPLESLRGLLPRLVPVLLGNMRYSDDDDEVLQVEEVREGNCQPARPMLQEERGQWRSIMHCANAEHRAPQIDAGRRAGSRLGSASVSSRGSSAWRRRTMTTTRL